MKMLLTREQVQRLIELLKQNQVGRADEELIRHLEMHLNLEQAWPVNLDEMPF
jgi:hypothetical protein